MPTREEIEAALLYQQQEAARCPEMRQMPKCARSSNTGLIHTVGASTLKQHVTLEELLDGLMTNFFRMQEQSYRFEKLHVDLTGERALPPEQPVQAGQGTDVKPPHLQTLSSLLNRYEQLANEQQLILDALSRHI